MPLIAKACSLDVRGKHDVFDLYDKLNLQNALLYFMTSEENIEVEGKIVAVLPSTMFRVELENGHKVLAHISGKLRKHFIKITVGDVVKMQMSPYDLNRGRIVYRLRNADSNRNAPIRSFGPRRR